MNARQRRTFIRAAARQDVTAVPVFPPWSLWPRWEPHIDGDAVYVDTPGGPQRFATASRVDAIRFGLIEKSLR